MDWTRVLPAVVGLFALLLGLYNLRRSISTADEVRSLAYAQRKQDVLAQILDGEAAYLSAQRQAQEVRDDAEDLKDSAAKLAIDQADFLTEDCKSSLALLEESRKALQSIDAAKSTHKQLVFLVEQQAAAVLDFTHTKKIEEQCAGVLLPARRLLNLITSAQGAKMPNPSFKRTPDGAA